MPSAADLVVDAFARSGLDLGALGLAWARVTPAVVLVPAFGLRALPAPARAILGLAFAAILAPTTAAHGAVAGPGAGVGAWTALGAEFARGLPVAIAAAVPLWAATMAGGVADALRGSQEAPSVPTVEGRATPLGVPFSLLASALFLAGGGPARVVAALRVGGDAAHPLLGAAHDIVAGVTLAVALGGPLLAASVILEVAAALVARAASPAQVQALLAPLRALGALGVLALVVERLASALALAVARAP